MLYNSDRFTKENLRCQLDQKNANEITLETNITFFLFKFSRVCHRFIATSCGFFVCLFGWLGGSLFQPSQLFGISHVIGLPNRKSWLAQSSSDRLVTLLDLPGTRFLHVNGACVLLMGERNQRASAVPLKEIVRSYV